MLKPVATVLPAQPTGPKPVWRDLFQEPAYAPGTEPLDQDDTEAEDQR